jgi:hypothetical protein
MSFSIFQLQFSAASAKLTFMGRSSMKEKNFHIENGIFPRRIL